MTRIGDLTGNVRFRQTLRGKLVMQVEVHDSAWLGGVVRFKSWRDARLHDIRTATLYGHTGPQVCLRMPLPEPPQGAEV